MLMRIWDVKFLFTRDFQGSLGMRRIKYAGTQHLRNKRGVHLYYLEKVQFFLY